MYNNPNNVWPSLVYPYGNPVPQAVGQMAVNTNVLPQNINYLPQYYDQNQVYGHQYYDYNYYQPQRPYGQTQANHNIATAYMSHPNHSAAIRHSAPHQSMITSVVTNNVPKRVTNEDKWMELLNQNQRQVLDQLNREQQEFEQQFKNWENDFEDWQRKNRSHPDINAYNLYVSQWQEWRQKLVNRQKDMIDLRSRTLQQLKTQVQSQMAPTSAHPKPPPPPPPPQAPPPPPPPPKEDQTSHSKTLFSNQNNNTDKSRTDEDFRVKSNNSVQKITLKDKQTSDKMNKNDKNIEVIEIDCEESVDPNQSQDKNNQSLPNPDPSALSKAAEDMLFIQKQQELLKSLDNLNDKLKDTKNNKNDEDIQLLEPKPFNINDIVTKMKAIKEPEDPMEANKILSELPALKGIVFKPNSNNDNRFDSNNQFNNEYNSSENSMANQRLPQMRHPFPVDRIPSRFPTPPYGNRPLIPHYPVDNRWTSPSNHSPQPPNVRTYLAQTIDYNHRHENSDLNSVSKPSPESHSSYPQKPSEAFPYDNNHYNRVNQNPSRSESFDNSRKHSSNLPKAVPEMRPIEETFSYNDIRFFTQPKSRIVLIDDLLRPPTREFRPQNIVIILRGLPGSGKTYFAKMIKEKEIEFGGSAPRILSIDDYFMAEVEREVRAPETGKMVKMKEYAYEYEKEMESYYRASLLKTYKKTLDDRLFSFIIIDAVNELIADIEDFYSYAIKNDFVVYVIEMVSNEPLVCHKNNIHNRKLEDIKQIHNKWQTLPDFMLRLDIRPLLQNASIKEVEMDLNETESEESLKRKHKNEDQMQNKHSKSLLDSCDDNSNGETRVSRWERMEASDSKLDKLDSFRMKSKPTIEEYLQVTDDYELRIGDQHKRVRWADIEEQKKHQRIRERGFEVGLNWHQYMDPSHPQRLLTETKYF